MTAIDLKDFFSNTLCKLLNQEGFEKVSIEVYPNRYKSLYSYDHKNRKGSTISRSLIEFIGIPVGSLLACYGNVLESAYPLSDEPVRVKLRLEGNMERVLATFKHGFIYKMKELLSEGITRLPSEILYHLIEYLTIQDLINLSLVNHEWHSLLGDEYIWKKIYQHYFGKITYWEVFSKDGTKILDWKTLVLKEYSKQKRQEEEQRFQQELSRRSLPAPTIFPALPPPMAIPLPPIPGAPIPLPPPNIWEAGVRRVERDRLWLAWNPFRDI